MVKKPKALSSLDTEVHRGQASQAQGSEVVGMGDINEHIERLKQVSLVTGNLANLLGDQLQGLSRTIPTLRGFEIVKELRDRSREHHDGMQDAFGPLRAHIEREKEQFYTKNADAIKKIIRERVEQGIKRKLPLVLKERVKHYQECLKANAVLTGGVEQVMTASSARAANSILSPNYSDEEVALIPPHPEWGILTLGNLKNIGGPAAAKLARDQGLTPSDGSPDSDQARIRNLNMILRHLGVEYQAVPSWNGILLTSVTRKTNN